MLYGIWRSFLLGVEKKGNSDADKSPNESKLIWGNNTWANSVVDYFNCKIKQALDLLLFIL
jgi:hypothetical protein